MAVKTMQASLFKAQCLSVLDEVESTHTTVVITKHGKAVARLVPIELDRPTLGSVTILAGTEDELFSTGEVWNGE
jgi:prevent-host-death family protein